MWRSQASNWQHQPELDKCCRSVSPGAVQLQRYSHPQIIHSWKPLSTTACSSMRRNLLAMCVATLVVAATAQAMDSMPRGMTHIGRSMAAGSTSGNGSNTPMFAEPCLNDSTQVRPHGHDGTEHGPHISNDHQASCAGYVYPDANITTDINNLCTAMPDMIGCTLVNSCKVRISTPPVACGIRIVRRNAAIPLDFATASAYWATFASTCP